jgi:hypothetical protein
MQTLITTHFGDVFDYGLLSEGNLCELSFYQMEVLLEKVGRLSRCLELEIHTDRDFADK